MNMQGVNDIKKHILEIQDTYLRGFPASAYNMFKRFMKDYKDQIQFKELEREGPFYRLRKRKTVDGELKQEYDLFHVPFDEIYKIANERFSIAGYPSLYFGNSIAGCRNEVVKNKEARECDLYVVKIDVNKEGMYRKAPIKVMVLDLTEKEAPLFPLFEECLMPINIDDLFHVQYVVPQLLLQWIRNNNEKIDGKTTIYGIKYSPNNETYINYVFPTHKQRNMRYCPKLIAAFKISKPVKFECNHQFSNLITNKISNKKIN